MIKMTTLFVRKFREHAAPILTEEVDPVNAWAITEGTAHRKFDGIGCLIKDGRLYRRMDKKPGKTLPTGSFECQAPDEFTGHHPHWVPCDQANPDDRFFVEAFESQDKDDLPDGTYELCGPKVLSNREDFGTHILVPHEGSVLDPPDRSFDCIKDFLMTHDMEGIVFHHPDGRMCKIRKKDYGIRR